MSGSRYIQLHASAHYGALSSPQPLRTSSRWRNPCFISSFLTVSSVASACHHGALHFGVGPLLVLLSSILYWQDPVREIALTLMAS